MIDDLLFGATGVVALAILAAIAMILTGASAWKWYKAKKEFPFTPLFFVMMAVGSLSGVLFHLGLADAYADNHQILLFVPFSRFLLMFIYISTIGVGFEGLRRTPNGHE